MWSGKCCLHCLPTRGEQMTQRRCVRRRAKCINEKHIYRQGPEHADFNTARLSKRQTQDSGGTVKTNTYDILTWSTGGAYYANDESCSASLIASLGVNYARLRRKSCAALDNSSNLTLITVTVGTSPQDQVVILDTGSSDLYLDSSSAATCQENGPNKCHMRFGVGVT